VCVCVCVCVFSRLTFERKKIQVHFSLRNGMSASILIPSFSFIFVTFFTYTKSYFKCSFELEHINIEHKIFLSISSIFLLVLGIKLHSR
jgi:lysylphosphatidylglycerol synthetase-like protein (DUF2156 family)